MRELSIYKIDCSKLNFVFDELNIVILHKHVLVQFGIRDERFWEAIQRKVIAQKPIDLDSPVKVLVVGYLFDDHFILDFERLLEPVLSIGVLRELLSLQFLVVEPLSLPI